MIRENQYTQIFFKNGHSLKLIHAKCNFFWLAKKKKHAKICTLKVYHLLRISFRLLCIAPKKYDGPPRI